MVKLILPFVQEHYIDHDNLRKDLNKFGIYNIKVHNDHLQHPIPYTKKAHKGFNVYYFLPAGKKNIKFIEWLYGYDIIQVLMKQIDNVNWIRLDGSNNMSKEFPIMDFYIRPNRHDGASRLKQECEINNIPYYWSYENPNMENIIELIENEFNNKQRTEL